MCFSLRQKDVRRKRGDHIAHLDSHKRCDTQMVHMAYEMTSIRTRKKTAAVNEDGRMNNDWLHEINCGRASLTNTLALGVSLLLCIMCSETMSLRMKASCYLDHG